MIRPKNSAFHGFTLSELLIGMAVGAVLAAVAVPGFASLRHRAALAASADGILGALYFAQRSAARTGIPAVFCLSSSGGACGAAAVDASGWRVFLDTSGPSALHPASSGVPLSESEIGGGIRIRGTRSAVTFWPAARAGTTATFILCDPRDTSSASAVIVSETGRPRAVATEATACAS
jgi:type IV fimbrial biogenesis protein FimT